MENNSWLRQQTACPRRRETAPVGSLNVSVCVMRNEECVWSVRKKNTLSRHFWQTPFTLPWVYRFAHISLGRDAASFLHCCAHDPTPIYRWRMVSSRGRVINNCDSASSLYNTIWPLDLIFTSSDVEETHIWAIKALCDPWPLLTSIRNMYRPETTFKPETPSSCSTPPSPVSLNLMDLGEYKKREQKNVMPLSKSIHCNLQ